MFKSFNSAACKRRFALQQPYMITYWTHTRRFFKSPVLEEDAAEDTDVIAPNPIAAPIATASEDTVVQ